MRTKYLFEIVIILAALSFISCGNPRSSILQSDVVFNTTLQGVRLGDGVPVNLDVNVRWNIQEAMEFIIQFPSPDTFNRRVLYPRAMEITSTVANRYPSVDSVFASQRELFLNDIKQTLKSKLGEKGMTIKEVTISRIGFPQSYTSAMEKVGMKQQLLEGIRQQNIVDLEQAAADRKKADADGQVAIARAEAQGRLAKIEAQTEESRRASEVAKAETAAQIYQREQRAEADGLRLIAKADLEKQTELKNLDIQKKRELNDLEIEKSRKQKRADLEDYVELAGVMQNNPNFASFLINKELASKVGIAVLPSGSDPNIFSGLLQQKMKEDKK